MAKIKITKKQLKQDEVTNFGTKLYLYVRDHNREVIIALVVALVVLVGLRIYASRKAAALEESNNFLTNITGVFHMALAESDAKKREEYFKQVLTYCDRLIQGYGGTRAARQASFMKGNVYYFLNDFDRAITEFRRYIDSAQTNEDRARGYNALGYAFENKFFYQGTDQTLLQEATKAYDLAAEAGKGTYLEYQALLAKARLLELKFKDEEAMAIYEKVMKDRAPEERPVKASKKTERLDLLYQQIKDAMDLFSFAKTAELNLDRLKGEKL
jgi:tetratricopeptide (TPR) repeat protein